MIKNTKKFFNIASALVLGSIILWNCEPDADSLGSQFFSGAEAIDASYDLIAYNINNNDSIRSDASKLDSAVIGAFSDPLFGMQKASYVTQVRLSSPDPDFGENAALDSAVLVIKPAYSKSTEAVFTDEDYVFTDEEGKEFPAKRVVTSYQVVKYGKDKILDENTVFNIKVYEVDDFLGASTEEIRSNKVVSSSNMIGSKTFNGVVSAIKVTKDSDNSDLFIREAGIRISLDQAFFQNKIIAKAGSPELADVASFIRYFKGIKLSVEENDGYLFKINPNSLELNLYYKSDSKDSEGTVTRPAQVFQMALGSVNTHFSQFTFDRPQSFNDAMASANDTINGNAKLYLQGTGGPGAGFKIQPDVINSLKDKFKNEKIGIISAKIRIYTDPVLWNNSYTKPDYFVVRQAKSYAFLTDMSALANTGVYNLVKTYDLDKNPAHYDIGITQTIKNIIEKEEVYKDFIINIGKYTYDANGYLNGSYDADWANNYNTRSYTPNRAVFVGTVLDKDDPLYDRGAKLLITYGKK